MSKEIIFYCSRYPELSEQLMGRICQALQLRREVLISGRNSQEVACARQVICHLLYSFTDLSFMQIGTLIGRSRPAVYYNNSEALKHLQTKDQLFTNYWLKSIRSILKSMDELPQEMFGNKQYIRRK
ncbi:helix-turn-helix domain-containing protein [Chitinophaga sp. Hz27]|uniref:helix-turn-helix domain-containing protein n=1 Tax=Chitinophaga sp. Hz27 TaxID=3347169 RepID=UPI0035E1B1E7